MQRFQTFFFKSLFKNWIMAILEDGIPRRKTFYLERDIIEAWTKRVEVGTDKDEAYELFKIKRVRLDDWYIKWGRKMLKVIRSVGLWITCTVMPLTEDYWKRNGFESKKKWRVTKVNFKSKEFETALDIKVEKINSHLGWKLRRSQKRLC